MATSSIPHAPGIYKITCIANGKIYVGSSCNMAQRCMVHRSALRGKYHDNTHLQRAWNKYGEQSFVFEVIELVMPWSLLDREQYWLDKLKPFDRNKGFNKNKIADKPPSQKGKPLSPEHRAKISAASLGKKKSPEAIAKSVNTRKGQKRAPFSAEHKQKIGLAHKGRIQPPEAIAKRIDTRSQWWIVITPEGDEIKVKNLKAFCRMNGLDQRHMSQVASGKQKHHKQWKCRHA